MKGFGSAFLTHYSKYPGYSRFSLSQVEIKNLMGQKQFFSYDIYNTQRVLSHVWFAHNVDQSSTPHNLFATFT